LRTGIFPLDIFLGSTLYFWLYVR